MINIGGMKVLLENEGVATKIGGGELILVGNDYLSKSFIEFATICFCLVISHIPKKLLLL